MISKETIEILESIISTYEILLGNGVNSDIPLEDDDIDAIRIAIADMKFLNFLVNVIPPNEMEKYREMYNCTNDKIIVDIC